MGIRILPFLVVLLLAALPAQAQDRVQTRGWSKPSYGRIIFDWPKPVRHSAQIDGNVLTVKFSRSMATDLDRVLKYLGGYVNSAELTSDGREARFGLVSEFELDSFASGPSVVVDLRRTQLSATPPRSAGTDMLRVRVGRHPGFTRLVFDWLDPVDYTVARDGRSVSMRFGKAANVDIQSLDAALPKPGFGSPSARTAGGDLMVYLAVPEQSFIRHFRDGAKVILDVQEEGGDFGGMVAGDATSGQMMMETISPTGEVIAVPAMVGTHVAVAPGGQVPLVTEEIGVVPAEEVPFQGSYSPLTHYDPNASGRPRNLLLYDRKAQPRSLNGS